MTPPNTIIIDTETAGFKGPVLSVAAVVYGPGLHVEFAALVNNGFDVDIHPKAFEAHGLTNEQCRAQGISPADVSAALTPLVNRCAEIHAFNAPFDEQMLNNMHFTQLFKPAWQKPWSCVMRAMCDVMKLPGKNGQYKWPKLSEAYKFVTGEDIQGAHNALVDVRATRVVLEWYRANHPRLV
jgi:DNA polymerase-3 subunit epsilon